MLTIELDEIDREILNMLQSDARTSFARIAHESKVSEATVRFRVKKLVEKGVIILFIALLDSGQLDYL